MSGRWGGRDTPVPDCPVALSPAGHAAHAGGPHPGDRQLQHRGLRRPGHVPALFRVAAGGAGLPLCGATRGVTVTPTPVRAGPALAAGAPSGRRPARRAPPDTASLSSKPRPGCSGDPSPGGRGGQLYLLCCIRASAGSEATGPLRSGRDESRNGQCPPVRSAVTAPGAEPPARPPTRLEPVPSVGGRPRGPGTWTALLSPSSLVLVLLVLWDVCTLCGVT